MCLLLVVTGLSDVRFKVFCSVEARSREYMCNVYLLFVFKLFPQLVVRTAGGQSAEADLSGGNAAALAS